MENSDKINTTPNGQKPANVIKEENIQKTNNKLEILIDEVSHKDGSNETKSRE